MLKIKTHPILVLLALVVLAGCGNVRDMKDGARLKPYEACPGLSGVGETETRLDDTVSQGDLREDDEFYTGKVNGRFTKNFPIKLTMEILEKGREEYRVFCSVCHDPKGEGRGIVIEKGFREPKSFNEDHLRSAPPGYVYDVITNGFVTMASYAKEISVEDRWAIAAYMKALQLSQNASIDDVPDSEREKLMGETP